LLNRIAKTIRAKRFKNGAIGFEKEEVRFQLDEKGKPLGLVIKVRKDAHLLIEDFMLLANETVAKFGSKLKLSKHPTPFVYRVHDKPDETKLAIFALMGKRFGYSLQFDSPKEVAPKLNDLLKKIEGKPEQNILENLAIRSMAKAEYTTKNIGHYGLAMDFYTHFTSPIRRYPDVMVHRLVYEALSDTPHLLDKETLEAYCKNSSLMERKANDAEREAVRYKQVEFLMDKVGEEFDGIIVGVIARGFFVEMVANKCEGMVSTESLGYEDFVYDETRVTLTGRSTGRIFRLGDTVKVQLVRADLAQRRIDLELVNVVD
jgi:ribonuclease R